MTSCRDVDCKHYVLEGRNWMCTCTKHDPCALLIVARETKARPLENRLSEIKHILARSGDASLVGYVMRDWPEVHVVKLDELAWAISKQDSYACRNDAVGLIELFEERWKERMS